MSVILGIRWAPRILTGREGNSLIVEGDQRRMVYG